jgi:subfamily B ATP-binding cassette protein MsbA
MVAIVGASGSGKSTLINLIPRFYELNNGDILIDGKSIKSLSLKKLRNLISIVTQESILFNASIEENILLGNQDQHKLIEASKIANAYEFINEYEEKYKYNVGDNGSNLSGGQKQRIAISRAVISNSPILILDEATSSLDSESEKLVQDALDKLMKNKTSIVIAHRFSTIKNSDKIIVLDSGKIVESGNHDELIKKDGYYSKLIKLQSFN